MTTKAERERKRRERVAYHEAGHVVLANFYKIKMRHASIVAEEESLGRVFFERFRKFDPAIRMSPGTERRIELYILILLAGRSAERK
jgi:ATP-dependent Zn protease